MTITPRLPYPLAVVAVCAGVGSLLTLCDRFFHVAFGALHYTHPTFTGQAWWVWPNFMLASGAMYLGAKLLFAARVRQPSMPQLLVSHALFIAVYGLSGVYHEHPQLLLWGFGLGWLLRLATMAGDRGVYALFGIVLALAGCAFEGLLTLTGEFAYRAPEFFHVPLWLAGLYLHGSFAILQLVRRVEARYGRLRAG